MVSSEHIGIALLLAVVTKCIVINSNTTGTNNMLATVVRIDASPLSLYEYAPRLP